MPTVADMFREPASQGAAPAPTDANPFQGPSPAEGPNPFQGPAKAAPPQTRTAAKSFGLGLRDVAQGAAGLVDIVAAPLNATVNAATGAHLSTSPARDAVNTVADMFGAPRAETPKDQMNAAIIGGATQGLLTAGVAGAATGAPGIAGNVARQVAAAPIIDTAAGAGSGAAAEGTRQAGGGPVAQLAAGLVAGGGVGVGAARLAEAGERVAASIGPKAAKVVTETPPEVLVHPDGELTPDGREAAARADVHPAEFKQAVHDFREATAKAANEDAQAPTAPDTEPQSVAQPVQRAVGSDVYDALTPSRGAAPEAPAAPRAPEAVAEAAPEAAPLPASAVERVAQAQSEQIPLTRGQATQDFAAQDAEQTLKASQDALGEQARQFYIKQQEAIQAAAERFKTSFGETDATAADRGQVVKDAIRELRDQGAAGVSRFYTHAREIAEGLGTNGDNLLRLDTAPLLGKMREIFIDEAVPDQVRKALKQQAAKYGLIGENPRTVEGETTVQLRDSNGEPSGTMTFTGPPKPLTIANAEELRQKINSLWQADTTKAAQALKPLIDDAVEQAVARVADDASPAGELGKTLQAGRQAHIAQKKTFAAKDIVQRLVDVKKGTDTDAVSAERGIKEVLGSGPETTANLKRVKAVLLSHPTEASKQAWQAIQAQGVADIFSKAVTLNANPGGGMLGTISGAKLNSAIAKFGPQKLKVLLGEAEFNQLMKLNRIIGDATIPISGTTNPSGSAYKLMTFLGGAASKAAPLLHAIPGGKLTQGVVHGAGALAKAGKEAAQAKETLAGVREFTPEVAAKVDAQAAKAAAKRGFDIQQIREFLAAGVGEKLVPSAVAALSQERPRS